MGIVKGIMLAGDFTLNSANSRSKEVTFETDNQDWDGTVYLSAILVSGGAVSLVLGSDTGHPIPIDDSGNYAGEINARDVPGFTVSSSVDAVVRLVVEIL